jgi:hypothetical protein
MQTTVSSDGTVHTDVRMHRDLSQGDPMGGLNAASHLPHDVDQFLEEAFEEHSDKLCVPRQLAALLRRPMADICESFDEMLDEGWRLQGVRPQELEAYDVSDMLAHRAARDHQG